MEGVVEVDEDALLESGLLQDGLCVFDVLEDEVVHGAVIEMEKFRDKGEGKGSIEAVAVASRPAKA